MLGDMELSLLIVSYDLPGTLCIGASFIGFFLPGRLSLGLPESCRYQTSPMVSEADVPAVAFPVKEMQQAERAGSSVAPSRTPPQHLQSALPSFWRESGGITHVCRCRPFL